MQVPIHLILAMISFTMAMALMDLLVDIKRRGPIAIGPGTPAD
jgi:hypothetical protein